MRRLLAWSSLVVAASCSQGPANNPGVTPANHTWFPISAGSGHEFGKTVPVDGEITCDSCHRPNADTFSVVRCDNCHKHSADITPRLHLGVPDSGVDLTGITDPDVQADKRGASCYACHPAGAHVDGFTHTGITDNCGPCHAPDTAFAALPKPNFTHREYGTSDCGACHLDVTDWAVVSGAPNDKFDPFRDVQVDALAPNWSGPVITSVSPDPQLLHMVMNHSATAIDPTLNAACNNCHAQADQGQFYPGVFHWALADRGLTQPTRCTECHQATPRGFVGPLDTARTPQSGEMRHDAVAWANGAPTATRLVTQECVVCHQPPADPTEPVWFFDSVLDDGGVPRMHATLSAAGQPQPTSCIDCHANSRPTGNVTSASITFDHSAELGDCAGCHLSFTTWAGGVYHRAGSATPSTCLPCHEPERPTSTAGWQGNFTASPFDYVTNADGVKHVGDLDCAVCHTGPGTGMWGSNANWRNGQYGHTATQLAASWCIDCHTTQRPDRLTPPADAGFDHAANGSGDCFACHEATVTRGSYVNLLPIPGGDWRGGQSYPGSTLISVPNQSVRVQSTALGRDAGFVVSMTTTTVNLPNAFRHTSPAIPAQVFPGPAASPDMMSCWHCHTSTGTTVTAYSNGLFHSALDNYRAMPGGPVTPLPQPTTCDDCHRGMRPPNIVSKTDAGTWLLPMDHAATFTGGSVTGVPAMDCGACHNTPGLGPTRWSDGKFHSNTPTGAAPSECVNCHYPLSTTAQADVTQNTNAMRHRSSRVRIQACATCHTMALGRATQTPVAATLWRTGLFHPNASPQPTGCTECHSASAPAMATQSTVVYTLTQGGTATNGGQWMNHGDSSVTSRDCAACHQADARASGSAWSRSAPYHAVVTNPSGCARCHGTTNGRGTVIGTNNNLPAGLIDSVTVTTSSAAAPGTRDQINHADSNVTRFDCNFCHTQAGPSTVAGVQGREWKQASFHRKFTAANPAIYDGTTGRCSNCHMNVKPGPAFTAFAHASYTATPGTQDCGSCHSWPGTNPANPNWLGAEGMPHGTSGATATSTLDCNSCHGQGGAATHKLSVPAASHYGGITNGNRCTSCHINFAGFKDTVTNLKYAHTNAAANAGNGCRNCHVFANQLYTTLTNTPALTFPTVAGGHQFSQTRSVSGSFDGDTFTTPHNNGTRLDVCGNCHQYSNTTSTTNIWNFKHKPSNPGIPSGNKSQANTMPGCNFCHPV
ncbi:MAG: hypothetical protein AB1938_17530 [Myxococcota bacterium]